MGDDMRLPPPDEHDQRRRRPPIWHTIRTGSHGLRGRSLGQPSGMTNREEGEVANPDRTHIDSEDQLSQGQPAKPEKKHDQSWSGVADEVRRAVEDA